MFNAPSMFGPPAMFRPPGMFTGRAAAATGVESAWCLGFDGINDLVETSAVNLTGDMAMSCWVRLASYPASFPMIACKGNINAEYLLFHGYGNGVVYFRVITNAGMQTIQTTAQLALGTWTHVAAVRSGSSAKIYFDGVEAASGTISGTGTTSANPLRIGAGWLGGSASNFLSGRIDEPRIYNRALAPTEITALYENTSPPTSGRACAKWRWNSSRRRNGTARRAWC